jgi:hypothetical protein
MDLEQLKRERDNALQQPSTQPPMSHPEHVSQSQDDDKNPELINSILKNYNGSAQQPQQSQPQQQEEDEQEQEMDLRGNIETLDENAEEFQVGSGAEIQYKYFNYLNEIKKVLLIVVLVLLFNNPLADKFIYCYVKKFIFTGESLNWVGYIAKAVLIGVIFFAISHFLLAI